MIETNQGLTRMYNALKDPAATEPRVVALRALHERMDRAVLDAYGWHDMPVPPYAPASPADRAAVSAFEDEVIDRLFALNVERARAEQRELAKARDGAASAPHPRRASKKKGAKGQGDLF